MYIGSALKYQYTSSVCIVFHSLYGLYSSGTAAVPKLSNPLVTIELYQRRQLVKANVNHSMPRAKRASRYSTSRQKSCQQCSSAKARCDRRPGRCIRCTQRGLPCAYPGTEEALGLGVFDESTASSLAVSEGRPPSPLSVSNSSFSGLASIRTGRSDGHHDHHASASASASLAWGGEAASEPQVLNFAHLELVCPINADDINNRWLNTFIPMPGQAVKEYPAGTNVFIHQTLKSYAGVAVNGRGGLPFIHPKQLSARHAALNTCLSLVRICSNPLPGSENATTSVLQREMHNIYETRETHTDEHDHLFAAFQAYLVYTLVLYFRLSQSCEEGFFRTAMACLQDLACSSARRGLVCAADQRRARPRWEEWITAEAKRRTLFVMYLLDSNLATREGLPTFFGSELAGLPAPGPRALWHASTRCEWEREYNIHLAEWVDGGLTIDELWPVPAGFDEVGIARRQARVDCWLEGLDELGTMLYAITCCTHGV